MRRALTKLLLEDHRSVEKRSCKRRDNNERPKYQNVRVSFSSGLRSACSPTLIHIHFAHRIAPPSLAAKSRCQRAQDKTWGGRACANRTALGSALSHLPCLRGFLLRCGLLGLRCGLVGTPTCLRRELIYLLLNGWRQLGSRDFVTVVHSEARQPRCRADKSTGGCR